MVDLLGGNPEEEEVALSEEKGPESGVAVGDGPDNMRHVVTEAGLSTRASQWWTSIPFVTAFLVAVCSAIFTVEVLLGYDSFYRVCLVPYKVASHLQVYRIYTSVLFHSSIFHLVFNMLALVPIGSALERVMGTVRFLHVVILLTTTNGIIHIVLAFLAVHNPIHSFTDVSVECSIGFSGVIFALIVIETSLSGTQNRSIFGLFTVPAKLYPWALLFLFQLLMPSVSLLGHLSGIISGFAYTFGFCNKFLCVPSVYSAVENATALGFCVRRPGFIVGGSNNSGTLPSLWTGRFSGGDQGFRNIWTGLQSFVSRGDTPVVEGQRFPGRGRSVGAVTGASPRQTGIEDRSSNNNSQEELQTRLLDREVLNSGEAEMQPMRTTSPIARQAGTGLSPQAVGFSTPSQVQSESPAIQSLLAMGFDKTRALVALTASNGDVTLAVEFLSAEGQ